MHCTNLLLMDLVLTCHEIVVEKRLERFLSRCFRFTCQTATVDCHVFFLKMHHAPHFNGRFWQILAVLVDIHVTGSGKPGL